ncbi:hypothetical protein M3611_26725 [Priestia megaterium]|uniref:hypothetical protein n=1 Tax=Priestia megaterium TaxID=1404 RepID=UPI00203ACFF1|nr:hypothetical protein [Priestia megaterium]MCM3155590.1 hypothetical protein [Priestia megaterium]
MNYILWKDKIIGKYCITKVEGVEDIDKLIKWLKKEMAGFAYPRRVEELVKSYRGNKVEFIDKLELIDCFKSGKNIHSFYYDLIQ